MSTAGIPIRTLDVLANDDSGSVAIGILQEALESCS